jgi:uncharacterized protein YrrD
MKLNNLIDVPVVTLNDGKNVGLIDKILLIENEIKWLVLFEGSVFQKAELVSFENIESIDDKGIYIKNKNAILKTTRKEFKEKYVDSYIDIIDYRIVDINDRLIGQIKDATISEKSGEVISYNVSRSLFDDLNYGYYYLDAVADIDYNDNGLKYNKSHWDMPEHIFGGIHEKFEEEDI